MQSNQSFYSELKNLEEQFAKQQPELELTVRDNSIGLEGYVVVWNSAPGKQGSLGPCGKGGTRITPSLNLDEVKMLAKIMALKNSAAGLAMGGAKSGIKANPDDPDFEKKYRRFVDLIKPVLRENGGIFGGLGFDIGARPIHPIWACDQLKSNKSFTGKPVEMGGTDYDREGIAGLGVAVAAKTLLEVTAAKLSQTTAAIQGLGAMGAAVFRYLNEYGIKVKYLSDPRIQGCIEFANGFSAELAESLANQNFAQSNLLIAKEATNKMPLEQILYQDVDLLLPSAVQEVITEQNVSKIKAKYLVEGANNPTTTEAYQYLIKHGVMIAPDFLANPGGIIAAFIELTSQITPEENLRTRKNVLDAKEYTIKKITENVKNVYKVATESGVDMVSASRMLALRNILNS